MTDLAPKRFDVELFIVHPSLSPSEISLALGLEAQHACAVGDQRTTPQGTELPGVHKDTRWRHSRTYIAAEQWFVEEVECLLNDLEAHKAFLYTIQASEGEATLIVQFLGDGYFGDSLSNVLLSRMMDLHLSFGIEVYNMP